MVLLLPTRCERLEQAIFLSEILRIFACPKTGLLTGHKDCISPVGRGGGGLLPHGSYAGLGPVSRKPRKLFGPAKPFLIACILKTKKRVGIKLCMKDNFIHVKNM